MPSSVQRLDVRDAAVAVLHRRRVAVLGYGAQGSAHALNLRDSGCDVVVSQRPGSDRHRDALADGFDPLDIEDAVRAADLLILALPDEVIPTVFERQIALNLRRGQALGFLHGFVIHYRRIEPPPDVDVVLVAPKGQGRGVRGAYVAGGGVPALVAIHQDASGAARETALGWAAGIGSGRAGVYETTFRDETETDLFGEQAVLCGGLTALIQAGFETLVEAGYPAELAYFECCHEVKLIADLIHEGGISYMRERISSTARFGDLSRGPRVVGPASRAAMRAILDEIRSGAFAEEMQRQSLEGDFVPRRMREGRAHEIERVGAGLRRAAIEPPRAPG